MPEIRIIVSGSRDGIWRETIDAQLGVIDDQAREAGHTVTLVHGDARGVDRMAAARAIDLGWPVESYPADWKRHGKRAGVIRNTEMLATGCTYVLAFWNGHSRGTKHMIDAAREAGCRVQVLDTMGRPLIGVAVGTNGETS